MKKCLGLFSVLAALTLTGCSIDYTSYYGKHGDVYNKDGTLDSEKINAGVKVYPSDNSSNISKYGYIYHSEYASDGAYLFKISGDGDKQFIDSTISPNKTFTLVYTGDVLTGVNDGTSTFDVDGSNHFIDTNTSKEYTITFDDLRDDYEVYASYYSQAHDVLYISYDKKSDRKQTIDSRQLAMMEEHAMNYFKSDNSRADYNKYLKVVRVYPDYVSSACHNMGTSEADYSKIEGCANYNQLEASLNLNGLTTIDRFFNPLNRTVGNTTYYTEPKRDTFAHEFGHISTYYNLILKGDGIYSEYLKLRLGSEYDTIYPSGLPATYDSNMTYKIQPVEILADDYVELFYDTSRKAYNDYYDYTLEYRDLRNSLDEVNNVHQFLKDDDEFYRTIKNYYNNFINNRRTSIEPKAINVTGDIYANPYDVNNNAVLKHLTDTKLIATEEVSIGSKIYYRVVLANRVTETNVRQEYSSNMGYVLKDDCTSLDNEVLYFTKYNGTTLDYGQYYTFEEKNAVIMPYYDHSYYYVTGSEVTIYDVLDTGFESFNITSDRFR